MGSIDRERQESSRKLLALGLNSTSPHYISDTLLHTFGTSVSYCIFVLSDIVLDANTITNVGGNTIIGVLLGPGYYHIACKQIQLVSGTALIYLTD